MSAAPWIALQFLTRLPVTLKQMPSDEQQGRSLLWYPAVGLLLGALLWGVFTLLSTAPTLLASALLVLFWVLLTGAMHLDGLADTFDAWVGGYGDRARTLDIMKDPRSGPIGVTAIVLVLLLKYAALSALLSAGQGAALLLAPWLARAALPVLFASTAYVRPNGLGQALAQHLPRAQLPYVLLAHLLAMLLLGRVAVVALLSAGFCVWVWRAVLLRRLGGTTGDTAGALVELVECAVLVTAALVV